MMANIKVFQNKTHSFLQKNNSSLVFALIIMFSQILVSCGSTDAKKIKLKGKDSTVLVLPPPSPISQTEATALGNACSNWYEHVLGRTGFNGMVLVAKGGNIIFEKFKGTGH